MSSPSIKVEFDETSDKVTYHFVKNGMEKNCEVQEMENFGFL